jgi:glycine C-acetyltransferase
LYKRERVIASGQQAVVRLADGREVVNLCANNYLGLANHPLLREAAHRAIDRYGYGMASVRFICGTQTVHRELEQRLSAFLGTDDTILYSSCFDANGGLFETITAENDAIISDALNHASIIDGIRLSKARRLRYANRDMNELEDCLKRSLDARTRLIVTDGVFSMDGTIAPLAEICDLADRFGAIVVVDDSHATGFMGEHSGGYTSGRREVVEWLRQRSRPYLFSNSVAPVVAATTLRVLELLDSMPELRSRLRDNTRHFRDRMTGLGFDVVPGEHPIIPVMLGDAPLAVRMADRLLELGVYVVGFSYPVVPLGKARIRTQMSAGHSREQLDRAIEAFATAGRELGVIR